MTQEEKAKAYDNVREKIAIRFGSNVADEIFSQFEMSEDERIMKELLEHLRKLLEIYDTLQTEEEYSKVQSWIAWLEKQGEKAKYHDICDKCVRQPTCQSDCFLQQGEQKPTDKVEPKFKVGDWVVRYGETLQISGIDTVLDGTFHYWFTKGTWLSSKKMENAMLWTIRDAKDGDVLYLQHDGKEHIIIYKGVIKERFRTFVSAYCAYNGIVDAFCFADVSRYIDIAYGGIMPATKEQRNLLFQKMKEAGYKWDAEKKELKKIEPKFKVGDVIRLKGSAAEYTIKRVTDTTYYTDGWSCSIERCEEDYELVEQKSVWSEEDERRFNNIFTLLEELPLSQNWLKSIKYRSQWKPSEEQMRVLDLAIRCGINRGTTEETTLVSLFNDLKKLK